MPESYIQLPPNSTGLKAHSFQKTIGANVVEDEVVVQGEPYLPTYKGWTGGLSTATVDAHIIQIMAGASLNVWIRRIRVFQLAVATTATLAFVDVVRLTTAGTGGTSQTVSPMDTTDAAVGATVMSLPTVKGTEGAGLDRQVAYFLQTVPASPGMGQALLYDFEYDSLRSKGLRIAAGTSNGVCVKLRTAVAAAQVTCTVEFVEASF